MSEHLDRETVALKLVNRTELTQREIADIVERSPAWVASVVNRSKTNPARKSDGNETLQRVLSDMPEGSSVQWDESLGEVVVLEWGDETGGETEP